MVGLFLGYFMADFITFNLMSLLYNLPIFIFKFYLDSIAYYFLGFILNIKHDKIKKDKTRGRFVCHIKLNFL